MGRTRIDQTQAELARGCRSGFGEHFWMRVKAHAQQRVRLARAGFKPLYEGRHQAFPSTSANNAMRTYMPFSIWRK